MGAMPLYNCWTGIWTGTVEWTIWNRLWNFLCKADNTSLHYVKLLFSFQLSQTSEESTAGKAANYAQNVSH